MFETFSQSKSWHSKRALRLPLPRILDPALRAPTQKRLRNGAAALSAHWEHLPTEALHGLTRAILIRAQVHADRIDLDVASGRLVRWLLDEGGKEAIDARLPN